MNLQVRSATFDDVSAIAELVQAGFKEHVAQDWESSARNDFLRDTTAEKLAGKIGEANFVVVYEHESQILGVLVMPRPSLVQLFFVAPGYLRRGIGRALWEAARVHLSERHPEITTVELNSSPYAVPSYKALGFFPISEPFLRKGAVATRMACWLPARSLERAPNVV